MSNGVFKVYLGDKLYYLIMAFIVRYEHADFWLLFGDKRWRDWLWITVMKVTNRGDQGMFRNN